MTADETVVAVLALTAGQGLDALLDVLTVVLAAWAVIAAAVAVTTWAATR